MISEKQKKVINLYLLCEDLPNINLKYFDYESELNLDKKIDFLTRVLKGEHISDEEKMNKEIFELISRPSENGR